MRVTIQGNVSQIKSVLEPIPVNRRARKNEANAIIRKQHALLRRAFEIVRRDPNEKEPSTAGEVESG